MIPRTYADDNDPLDVLVLSSEVIQPLSLVRCYPIGVITMLDQGRLDEKIIAIPFQDPSYNSYHDVSELPLAAVLAEALARVGVPAEAVTLVDQSENWWTPEAVRV